MKLERNLLNAILRHLAEQYGPDTPEGTIDGLTAIAGTEDRLIPHMFYLEKLGLIHSGISHGTDGSVLDNESDIRITAKGIKWLGADEGFSEEHRALIINLHQDILNLLSEALAKEASVQPAQSASVLRMLSEETAKHACLKVFDAGLLKAGELLPDLLQQVKNSLF